MAKHEDVSVKLVGEDGNVFAIISRVGLALKRAGHKDAAREFMNSAFNSASYDEVLQLVSDYVHVE